MPELVLGKQGPQHLGQGVDIDDLAVPHYPRCELRVGRPFDGDAPRAGLHCGHVARLDIQPDN